MARLWTALILFFMFCFVPLRAGSVCYTSSASYPYYTEYCTFGCCNYDCCADPDPDPDLNINVPTIGVWVYGVSAAGAIVFIGIIVTIICCCIKAQGRSGRVISTQPQPAVTVVSSAQNSSTMQHQQQQGYYGLPQSTYGPSQGFSYSSWPPGYSQAYATPPGPPAYSDPAYPPSQTNMPASPFASAAGTSAY